METNMGVVPETVMPESGGGRYIKGTEFDGKGLVLKVKGFEVVAATNPKFGAGDNDYLFKEGKLLKGQTFRYTFEDVMGNERILDSKSPGLLFAFGRVNPNPGDMVKISKTGKLDATRYTVELLPGVIND